MKNSQEDYITEGLNKPLKPSTRNYGIDMLRIFAMLMIVTLHVLGRGGMLYNTKPFTPRYEICWAIEMFCFIGVNIYALISGYVGLCSKYKPYKIITMWIQVEIYNLIALGIVYKTGIIDLSRIDIVKYFFPVVFNGYWYFTAYVGLFLFIPLLNKLIQTLEKKTADRFLLFAAILFSIAELINTDNALGLKKGYSMIYLILLYIVGGYLKKYDIAKYFSKLQLSIIFIFSFIVTIAGKNLLQYTYEQTGIKLLKNMLFKSYNNILFVISAVSLLLLCSKINIKNSLAIRSIKLLAPLTFGVYIIHLTPVSWHYLENATKFLLDKPIYVMVCGIIVFTIGIFVVCVCIDYVRAMLFKVLRIEHISQWIYGVMACVWHSVKKAAVAFYRLTSPKSSK